jgi:hypothetical protein
LQRQPFRRDFIGLTEASSSPSPLGDKARAHKLGDAKHARVRSIDILSMTHTMKTRPTSAFHAAGISIA